MIEYNSRLVQSKCLLFTVILNAQERLANTTIYMELLLYNSYPLPLFFHSSPTDFLYFPS